MKTQKFGIEIELTGITRKKAADVIAEYFGTEKFYIGTYYQTYGAKDRKGRTWKATFDSSIIAQRKKGGRREPASEEYKCEIVSPILEYEDLEDLQEIVRQLRHKGAFVSDQCGIHNGSGLNVIYGEDCVKKIPLVKTICYGKIQEWYSREKAEEVFFQAILGSEGSEQSRYMKIYNELKMGLAVCTDGEDL